MTIFFCSKSFLVTRSTILGSWIYLLGLSSLIWLLGILAKFLERLMMRSVSEVVQLCREEGIQVYHHGCQLLFQQYLRPLGTGTLLHHIELLHYCEELTPSCAAHIDHLHILLHCGCFWPAEVLTGPGILDFDCGLDGAWSDGFWAPQ